MQFVHCSIISFWAVLPPRASIGHKSFKCGGLPSFRLDLTLLGLLRLEQGRRELFNLCASDQFACRQTNFVMQSQAVHLLLSRLERLTYVNDKSKGGVEPPTMWHTRWRTRWRRLFDLQQGSFKRKSRRKLKPGTCINKSPQT